MQTSAAPNDRIATRWRQMRLLAHAIHWRLNWARFDLDLPPPPGLGPRFMTAREAVARIPDRATVIACGMAAHHRASIFYWAIRDRFQHTAHPRGLTMCAVGALGGRGRVPGALEELGLPGLVDTAIMGHVETVKSFLQLASAGQLELHTLPQGEFAFLVEAQAHGRLARESEVGLGTFLDPAVGHGSALTAAPRRQFVERAGARLRYSLPALQVALISAPYADSEGNIYVKNAVCLTEIRDAARAVRANGGQVLITVSDLLPADPPAVYLRCDEVDAIVVNPSNEQTGSVLQRQFWPMFTPGRGVDETQALADVDFLNGLMNITPQRGWVDEALSRLAASIVAAEVRPGALVNIGVGLPEQVGRQLHAAGLAQDLVQSTETGVVGGLPTSGIFFGAAINPQRQESSAWLFHHYERALDLACLGMLEVDSAGNVNVSRRGEDPTHCVGPGGFTDIVASARVLVFVGAFARGARLRVDGERLVVDAPGAPKFVAAVREITFNGARALARGQRVWYVTPLGVFRLQRRGLVLVRVMPGVDPARDIVACSGARIHVPRKGPARVDASVLTGREFHLAWGAEAAR